eukprot:2996235-Rhodomonas_salina.1
MHMCGSSWAMRHGSTGFGAGCPSEDRQASEKSGERVCSRAWVRTVCVCVVLVCVLLSLPPFLPPSLPSSSRARELALSCCGGEGWGEREAWCGWAGVGGCVCSRLRAASALRACETRVASARITM